MRDLDARVLQAVDSDLERATDDDVALLANGRTEIVAFALRRLQVRGLVEEAVRPGRWLRTRADDEVLNDNGHHEEAHRRPMSASALAAHQATHPGDTDLMDVSGKVRIGGSSGRITGLISSTRRGRAA